MNQKNIFTVIAIFLLFWALSFYFIGEKVVGDSFPGLSEEGMYAAIINAQLASTFLIIIALMVWATRNVPQVLGYFTIGTTILVMVTLKHIFIDGVSVPIVAPIFQGIVALLSGYLWYKNRITNSQMDA
jgi:hypothetical protein